MFTLRGGEGGERADRRRSWIPWVGTAIGLILLVILLGRQDWGDLVSNVSRLPARSLLAALVLFGLTHAINTARWLTLVRSLDIRLRYRDAFRLVLAGHFASNFLPSTVGGDITRIAGILPRSTDRVAGAASVVADRLVSLLGMCFLIPLSFPILSSWISGGVPLAASFGAANERPDGDKPPNLFERVRSVFAIWRRRPVSALQALALSWIGVAAYLLGMWLLALGLGIPVDLGQVAGATTITYFLTLVPISINGYGIREAAILAVYLPLGARPEQATALALLSRALAVLVTTPGALWLGRIPLSGIPSATGGRE